MKQLITSLLLATIVTTSALAQETTTQSSEKLVTPWSYSTKLKEVRVNGYATRAEQKGDTLEYKASAFKVLEGSTAEDLLSKMPGVVVEGGEVQAQGETVTKILIDGKEYFEGDVNLAIRSIPSDAIEAIQVYDKKSDQAEFTGFDDGEEVKTINIITKPSYRKRNFGEGSAGYGTDDRYKANATLNIFDNDRRITVLGMSNNINVQNFSQDDLSGVISSSQSSGGRGRMGGGSGGPGRSGGGSGGGSSTKVSSSEGVSTNHGTGVNYNDQWGEKVTFQGSYFFNLSDNLSIKDSYRKYFDESTGIDSYTENSNSNTENWNHRFNSRIEYKISNRATLMVVPSFSFQDVYTDKLTEQINTLSDGTTEDLTTDSDGHTTAYNASTNITYRQRLGKVGRTLSLMLTGSTSNTDGTNTYIYDGTSNTYDNQQRITDRTSYSLRSSLNYTEAIGRRLMLMGTYKVSYSYNDSNVSQYNEDIYGAFTDLDSELSNVYNSGYLTQSANLGLRYYYDKLSFSIEGGAQYATLDGDQTLPVSSSSIDRNYLSFLPSAMLRYAVDRQNSFMFNYRSSTSSPSITDLQDVYDTTDPYFVSSGNSDLDQSVSHNATLRYTRTTSKAQTIILMLGATYTQDYVADNTVTIGSGGYTLPGTTTTLDEGAQITTPINMSGYYTANTMFTYGFPFSLLRCNINLSVNAKYSHVPTTLDSVESFTEELTLTPKVVIGSNISDKLDYTLTYSASYNNALSSAEGSSSDNYMSHSVGAKLGWEFWKGFIARGAYSFTGYSGISEEDGAINYNILSCSLGKRFGKKGDKELRVEAYDVLQQAASFKRTVGSNYYQYTNSNILSSYVMLTFVYRLK
ncbi:MAG: outer membrane beta-barrel protein [Rikenellaceae bacterium]